MITDAERQWHQDNLALRRQAEQEEVAKYRAWREGVERKLRAKRAAAAPKAPPPPATSGLGWTVLEHPNVPHQALQAHAERVWDFCFHSIDFPASWRIRWGRLDPLLLRLAGAADRCAAGLFGTVLGLCVMTPRIILIDEEAQRSRSPREFGTTLIHELIHSQQHGVMHGPRFEQALRSATDFFFGATDAPAPVLARPEPPKGVRFRPGLDPALEYRGETLRQGD